MPPQGRPGGPVAPEPAEEAPAGSWEDRRYEDAVAQAQARGTFEHLPGKGSPLSARSADGLGELHAEWLSLKVLKNSGFVPEWIELARRIDGLRARAESVAARWRVAAGPAREACARELETIWLQENELIRRYNRAVPHPSLQRYPLPVPFRWERLRAASGPGG
jgi:hypothetical protein